VLISKVTEIISSCPQLITMS